MESSGRNAAMAGINRFESNAPSRLPAVQVAMDDLHGALGDLHDAVSMMEKRLHIVLEPPTPSEVSEAQPAPENLAKRIATLTRGVRAAAGRLHEMHNRLEL